MMRCWAGYIVGLLYQLPAPNPMLEYWSMHGEGCRTTFEIVLPALTELADTDQTAPPMLGASPAA
jgi:hypothetical protein